MSMPNFTAEASLYATTALYRTATVGGSMTDGRAILPQLRSTGFCMADCDFNSTDPLSNAACKFDCLNDGGGGGGPSGPGGPSCKPSCGPCVDGTRLCIKADCDTYERSCGRVGRGGQLSQLSQLS